MVSGAALLSLSLFVVFFSNVAVHPHCIGGLVAIQDSVDGVVACLQANLMFFVFRLCVATGEHSDAAEEDSGEREEVLFHKDICL